MLTRKPRVPGQDRLVDWQLVLQAYGIVGMLETVASFAMSYWYLERNGIPFNDIWFSFGQLPKNIDPDYYQQKLYEASSISGDVPRQWFNLLAVRTRRLFPAIAFACIMAIFWLYPPAFQRVLDTTAVPVEHWFLPMAFGLGLILLDEARKYFVRTRPRGILAKLAW